MINNNSNELSWVIHLVADGYYCEECGECHDDQFIELMCDAHTYGLTEQFGHKEFQFVLAYDPELICYILNTLGRRVQEGEQFHDGQDVYQIISDADGNDVPVKIKEIEGRLRVIVPDPQFLFPEDASCVYPYNMQAFPVSALMLDSDTSCNKSNN